MLQLQADVLRKDNRHKRQQQQRRPTPHDGLTEVMLRYIMRQAMLATKYYSMHKAMLSVLQSYVYKDICKP